MKYLILLLSVAFSNLAYSDSLDARESPLKLNKRVAELTLDNDASDRRLRDQNDITRMYFFVNHIDEVDTLDKIKLKAFLSGLKSGFGINFNMEKKTFGRAWFCRDKTPFYGRNSDEYIVDLIKWVYKNYPDRFSKDVGIYSHTSSALAFGLQVNFRCHQDPQVHIAGYDYSHLPAIIN